MKKTLLNSEDIARLAGVSRSTVSRVINNYANVPPETRARVEKVIKEYGYVPHMEHERWHNVPYGNDCLHKLMFRT